MANELLTREDIVRAKQNVDAHDKYLDGAPDEKVKLPSGKVIKTRAGVEKEIKEMFPAGSVGFLYAGAGINEVPTGKDTYKAAFSYVDGYYNAETSINIDELSAGTRYLVAANLMDELLRADDNFYFLETVTISGSGALLQKAWGYTTGSLFLRSFVGSSGEKKWSNWRHASMSKRNYSATTALQPNVVVTATGEFQRSTSSRVFKDNIKPLEVENYRESLRMFEPVSYNSKHTSDNPEWIWYSFIAEDLAEIDPSLVQLSSVEFYEDTDEDGNTFVNNRQLPEGEYAPVGLNFNGITTMLTRINQLMLDDIEALESEKTQLKSRMTKAEKRADDLEKRLAELEKSIKAN